MPTLCSDAGRCSGGCSSGTSGAAASSSGSPGTTPGGDAPLPARPAVHVAPEALTNGLTSSSLQPLGDTNRDSLPSQCGGEDTQRDCGSGLTLPTPPPPRPDSLVSPSLTPPPGPCSSLSDSSAGVTERQGAAESEEDGFLLLSATDALQLPEERWHAVDWIPTEERPCAAFRRHDFGPGLRTCADCGKSPTLNRGCARCGVRLCSRCFEHHRKRGAEMTRTDFEVLRPLGSGASAEVLLARRRVTGKFYALKVMKKSAVLGRREGQARSERDVMASVPARSPFLLKLHGAFQSPTRMFLVLDFMPGGDLYEYIKRNRGGLIDPAAKRAAAQVLEGLLALHEAGFVHRDIKPENVLLDENGNCKIADFGLTKNEERCQSFVGTDLYIAPELLQSRRRVHHTKASDWWAFGCLVVNLLTGCDPFPGKTPAEVYGAVLRSPPRLYGADFSEARTLVLKLLIKDPLQRLTGEQAKQHVWFADIDWSRLSEGVMPGWVPPRISSPPPGKGQPLTESRGEDDFAHVPGFSLTVDELSAN